MRQLIYHVHSHHRERDADSLALARKDGCTPAVLIAKPLRQMAATSSRCAPAQWSPAPARPAGQAVDPGAFNG